MRLPLLILLFSTFFYLPSLDSQDLYLEQSEEVVKEPNEIKVSPIQFGKAFFELSYELMLNGGRKSIQFSPTIMLKKSAFEEFSGLQLEAQYRSYIKRLDRPDHNTWIFSDIDFYAGGYMSGTTFDSDAMRYHYDQERMEQITGIYNQKIKSLEGGVFVGIKLTFSDRLVLDLLAGGGVRYSDVDDPFSEMFDDSYIPRTYDVFDVGYFGIKPKLNLQLGITL